MPEPIGSEPPLHASSTIQDLPRSDRWQGRGARGLWFAFGASAFGWMTGQVLAYALTQHQCVARSSWPLHAVTVTCLLVVIAGGVVSAGYWARVGRSWPDDAGGPEMRMRFVAAVATLSSFIFGAILLFQWVSEFILHPCLTT